MVKQFSSYTGYQWCRFSLSPQVWHFYTTDGHRGFALRSVPAFTSMIRLIALVATLLFFCNTLLMAQSQTRKAKAGKYQDEVVLVYKNQFAVRLPVLYYGYHLFQNTYKTGSLPLILGARYERLFGSHVTGGLEWEYNSWDPYPSDPIKKQALRQEKDAPPEEESVSKFNFFAKFYFRSNQNRKRTFQGMTLAIGPSVFSVQQVKEESKPNLINLNNSRYKASTEVGLFMAPGLSVVKDPLVFSAQAEVLFSQKQFRQEGFISTNLGNGSIQLNLVKFYVGLIF